MAATTTEQTLAVGEAAPDPLLTRLHQQTTTYLNGVLQPSFFGGPPGVRAGIGPGQQSGAQGVAAPGIQGAAAPGIQGGAAAGNPTGAAAGIQPGAAPFAASQTNVPFGLPPWASDLHGNQFRGLVLDGEDLYLVAIDQRRIEGDGRLTVIDSLHVDSALVDVLAQGLGRVRLSGLMTGGPHLPAVSRPSGEAGAGPGAPRITGQEMQRTSVYGGTEPQAVNLCDLRVPFISTLDITDWESGSLDNVPIEVHSRPSLLYRQLFGGSLGGVVTGFIRDGLIALCILFTLIETLALYMAIRLSRTITASVETLYAATQRVDHGDFVHRINIPRSEIQPDQLGELSLSFNRMTGSLERLMVEQKEKDRLQSELNIAQEVQANLFPHDLHDLPTLQLHGVCRPARLVSGDYYDFLVFHHPNGPDGQPGVESGVGILLGDISGKGISAALLMATLHSAVRAYRLASEDLVYSESTFAEYSAGGMQIPAEREAAAGDGGKLFESPGRILALLNRHLFRSTQPEKYATLFLAHYDAGTARLTYSNAGHPPPFVLGGDGKLLRRLDCGGTVVGLIDGMRYQQSHFQMNCGDIMVAYSDGVTEPENDFGEFGEARLMEVVARYRDQPLEVISAQVMLALDAWIGAAEQPDDITLVLARQI